MSFLEVLPQKVYMSILSSLHLSSCCKRLQARPLGIDEAAESIGHGHWQQEVHVQDPRARDHHQNRLLQHEPQRTIDF